MRAAFFVVRELVANPTPTPSTPRRRRSRRPRLSLLPALRVRTAPTSASRTQPGV